jgi:hypothetical protein
MHFPLNVKLGYVSIRVVVSVGFGIKLGHFKAHPSSQLGPTDFFPGVKRPGREFNSSLYFRG